MQDATSENKQTDTQMSSEQIRKHFESILPAFLLLVSDVSQPDNVAEVRSSMELLQERIAECKALVRNMSGIDIPVSEQQALLEKLEVTLQRKTEFVEKFVSS